MAQVLLKNVTKVYPGDILAVDDFNLEIADQEFVVLVGPSGCGKSTTLRMIAGLEEISGGTIQIDQRVVNDVPPKDRDIAMVFQNYALYPHMTVYKNMAFALKLRGVDKKVIAQKVQAAAKILGIEGLLERKPKALSGGQRQRVAVGRAIVRDPKCFLFDEPLSNLDAKLRVEMRAELKRLHRQLRTTTVYVTHDQEEAMTLGDRVVVMKDGVIQQVGSPLDIYRHPANRFVAGFLGTPPMNFLTGQLAGRGGALYFNEGTVELEVPAWAAEGLAGRAGQKVILGVRPEAISDAASGPFAQRANALPVAVSVVEPLGDKIDVYLATKAHPHLIARLDAHSGIQPDSTMTAYLDMSRVHFFDPQTGENLSLEAEKGAVMASR